jgi:hypothetical protein
MKTKSTAAARMILITEELRARNDRLEAAHQARARSALVAQTKSTHLTPEQVIEIYGYTVGRRLVRLGGGK